MQLHAGFTQPSGLTDPHLVAKGSITTGVGATCAALGATAACSAHLAYLFVVAFCLGVSGLTAATAVDANVAGLCSKCSEQPPEDEESEDEELDDRSDVSTAGYQHLNHIFRTAHPETSCEGTPEFKDDTDWMDFGLSTASTVDSLPAIWLMEDRADDTGALLPRSCLHGAIRKAQDY
jgi:hypothetical protein